MTSLVELFSKAEQLYTQNGTIDDYLYVSRKQINNIQLAVLPQKDQYVFTSYNIGNSEDIKTLRAEAEKGTFKCYDCSLCAILEKDNALLSSDEQNQLTLAKNSPAVKVQSQWTAPSGLIYNITGTVPQYYYNHLLFSSAAHIPTYAIFFDQRLIFDIFIYLKTETPTVPNLVAFFNGNFGSDTWHFHTHLTNQNNTVLDTVLNTPSVQNDGVFFWEDGNLIKLIVFNFKELHMMATALRNNIKTILHIRDTMGITVSANFLYRKDRFWTTLQLTKTGKNIWQYKDTTFGLFAPSFMLAIFNNNFQVPIGKQEITEFSLLMKENYKDFYIDGTLLGFTGEARNSARFNQWTHDITTNQGIPKPLGEILSDPSIEHLFYLLEIQRLSKNINEDAAENLLPFVKTVNCFKNDVNCEPYNMGRFRYIISIIFNYLKFSRLGDQDIREIQITGVFHELYNLNTFKNINTSYMYFRGEVIGDILLQTIQNLLIISQNEPKYITEQTSQITEWMDYTFSQIGEPSSSGTNTLTKLKFPNIDMIMKIMLIEAPEKLKEFTHEFWASLEVNKIRQYIPNFILTYGGFSCNTSDNTKTLCDLPIGSALDTKFSYLLLENIEKSNTLRRENQLPTLRYPGQELDMLDGIAQIVTALTFGWNIKQFTHYDLHTDNIMVYDFIHNKNFLKLFKIYKENAGNQIPVISNILFQYYVTDKDYFYLPAKYLYLIIDYGHSYIQGMPDGTMFQLPRRQAAGIITTKPNKCADLYTLFIVQYQEILLYKPYLLIKDKKWLDGTPLVDFFWKFISSFRELWNETPKRVWELLLIVATKKHAAPFVAMEKLWIGIIKSKYKSLGWHYWYLPPRFLCDEIPEWGFNSSQKALAWLVTNHYKKLTINGKSLEQLALEPTTYIFKWGHVPDNEINGIQPNEQIKQLIQQKLTTRQELIKKTKQLMKQVPE